VGQICERMGLTPYANRRAGNLSQGNAQRLGLAKALLHNPKLLFLDEPANGLDPAGIVEIRELLRQLTRERGVTVFMSSHILAEVALLAGRIGIIHNGRLLQELSIGELERNRRRRLVLRVREIEPALRILAGAGYRAEILRAKTLEEESIALKNAAAVERPDEINRLLVTAGCAPTQLMVEEEALEHYFLRLIGANGGSQDE
jgi:ABC-2 type transport system ATP-binding protein